MIKRVVAIIAISLSFTISFAQVENSANSTRRIENYLNKLESVGFSGTVLVELEGKKVISKGYGYSDKEHLVKNTPSTIFSTGSITKQFTATGILKLEMQKRLSTEDRISKYFENVPEDKKDITIHDLLRHQSGLISNVGGDFEKINEKDFINAVLNSALLFKKGARFSYSNIGYSLLAIIIEKVSGEPYENFLYEKLWKQAGMEMTGYSRPKFDTNKIAVGYYKDGRVWGKFTDMQWDNGAPYWHLKGNGGILSTSEDLYKWRKALMSDQILSKEARSKLYFPVLRPNEKENPYYAYGWDVFKTDRNTYRIWHNGTNNIIYADYMCFINENITLIMLSNQSNQNFDRLNFELSKIIFQKNYNPIIPIADNESNRNFTQSIIEIIINRGLEAGKSAFSKRPSKTDLLESTVNTKGYELLSQKNYDKAITVFLMNCFAFPKSSNAFDSLGEAYLSNGDNASAKRSYEKSLELDPTNRNAEDILKKLK